MSFIGLTCVLAGVVHGRHTRRLLRRGVLLQAVEEKRSEREFGVGLDDIAVQRVVDGQLGSVCHSRLAEDRDFGRAEGDNGTEQIVQDLSIAKVDSGIDDVLGDDGSVSENEWFATDLSSDHSDVLSMQPYYKVS